VAGSSFTGANVYATAPLGIALQDAPYALADAGMVPNGFFGSQAAAAAAAGPTLQVVRVSELISDRS